MFKFCFQVIESEKRQALAEVSIRTAERKLESEMEENKKLQSEVDDSQIYRQTLMYYSFKLSTGYNCHQQQYYFAPVVFNVLFLGRSFICFYT